MQVDNFYRNMMEMISLAEDNNFSKSDFLKKSCEYFDISHGFIYEADIEGVYVKKASYTKPPLTPHKDRVELIEAFGNELFSELSSQKIIISTGEDEGNYLVNKLKLLLNANTLIIVPILNQHYEIMGFVGLTDRRKNVRNDNIDIKASAAVLTLLANHVKLEMFKKGIANTERVLNNVLDNVGIDIYVNDYYTHDILYVNKSMAKPYGGVEKMMGQKCWQALYTDKDMQCDFCPQPKLLDEDDKPNKKFTWDYNRELDGSWFRVLSSSIPWTDGRIAHLVASVDITESKLNQLLIEKLAQYDYLTGLANRRSLHDDVEKFSTDTTLFSDRWFVLFCDLDGFKIINDTLGHEAGDVLLQSISKNLTYFSDENIRAYRHGGDEFVMLVKDEGSVEKLEYTLDKLFDIFCKKYSFNDNEMKCGCSIGISHFPDNALLPKDLFFLADSAMYAAKKSGKGVVRFIDNDKFITLEEYKHKKGD